MTTSPNAVWSKHPELLSQLKEMLLDTNQDDISYSDIARKLGHGITRCAVAGKIAREKLLSAPKRRPMRGPNAAPKKAKSEPKPPSIPALTGEQITPLNGVGVSIEALNSHTCRFPYGDPQKEGLFFCGHTRQPGRPYCAEHLRCTHQPAKSAAA